MQFLNVNLLLLVRVIYREIIIDISFCHAKSKLDPVPNCVYYDSYTLRYVISVSIVIHIETRCQTKSEIRTC